VTIRVVVADDHAPTRLGVRMALEDGGFEVVHEAATGPAAVAAVLEHSPDVALLDVHMPGDGIAAARAISSRLPQVAVVMLTVSRDDGDLFQALRAGARGYLLKDIDPERLPHALRGVLAGEAALPRGLVTKLVEEFRHRERSAGRRSGPAAALTAREWEVVDLLGRGLDTAEIAARLFVTPVTVRTHVSAVLRKLKVDSREQAVRLLRDTGPE
jgi:DNA-binding NarL/FixJ family response regulator